MSVVKNYLRCRADDGAGNITIEEKPRYELLSYASLGWKANSTAQTFSATNEWKDIPSDVPLTFQMTSGDATIVGDSSGYYVQYTSSRTIKARCAVHFGVDMSGGTSIKKVAFRMLFNGVPLDPFLEMESNKDGEHGGSEMLLDLAQDDILDFQFCNMTNTDSITVKYMQVVATEL